jgi:SPP1 family predicted phage head-tail adaptor
VAGAIRRKKIGELRHRCTLEKLAASPERDAYGAEVHAWTAEATVFCRVEPRPTDANERRSGSRQQADCTHVVTMRLRADVTPKKRFKWLRAGGIETTLNVVAVAPMEGDENWLEVWCKSEQ